MSDNKKESHLTATNSEKRKKDATIREYNFCAKNGVFHQNESSIIEGREEKKENIPKLEDIIFAPKIVTC